MKQHLGMALGFALWCCSAGAGAQGVLDRVAAGETLVSTASLRFRSPYVHQGKPMGYADDLCLRLAEAVRKKTGMKDMAVAFLQVTPENRMAMVEQGKAALRRADFGYVLRLRDEGFALQHLYPLIPSPL